MACQAVAVHAGEQDFTRAARGQPRFYLLDGQGKVVESWAGPVREATFRAAFDRLLAGEGG